MNVTVKYTRPSFIHACICIYSTFIYIYIDTLPQHLLFVLYYCTSIDSILVAYCISSTALHPLSLHWLQQYEPTIDWKSGSVSVSVDGKQIVLPKYSDASDDSMIVSSLQFSRMIRHPDSKYGVLFISSVDATKESSNSEVIDAEVQSLLNKYSDVFPDDLPAGLPPEREVDHKIEIIPGSEPPVRAPYRMSIPELDELKKQLNELIEKGHIRVSKSQYRSPVLFVKRRTVACDCVLITVH